MSDIRGNRSPPPPRIGEAVPSILAVVMLPPAPERTFASDNAAGAHPNIIEAVVRANRGHALAYGDDEWTRRTEASFCRALRS